MRSHLHNLIGEILVLRNGAWKVARVPVIVWRLHPGVVVDPVAGAALTQHTTHYTTLYTQTHVRTMACRAAGQTASERTSER